VEEAANRGRIAVLLALATPGLVEKL